MDLVKLGNNISTIRRSLGLKQETVAIDLDISITSYAKIERGETNVPFLRLLQIADYFHVHIVELVREKEELNFQNLVSDITQIKNAIKSIDSKILK